MHDTASNLGLKPPNGGRVEASSTDPNDPWDALQRSIDAPRGTVISWPSFALRSLAVR